MIFYKNPSIQAQSRQQSCFKSIILAPGRKKNTIKSVREVWRMVRRSEASTLNTRGMKTLVGEMRGGGAKAEPTGGGWREEGGDVHG